MILAFASSKGGVGKSTTCAAIACALAMEGQSVLIIDLDQNQTLGDWRRSFDIPLVTVETIPPQQLATHFYEQLEGGLYDHILIDLMGAREVTQLKAYALADLVIIPSQPSRPDLTQAIVVAKDVLTIARETGRTIPYRLLLTKMDSRKTRVGDYASQQLAEKSMPCFQTMLVNRVAYREMFLVGELPTLGEEGRCAGADVRNLLLEIRAAIEGNPDATIEDELQEAV
jgi:chromosome partitioning protein